MLSQLVQSFPLLEEDPRRIVEINERYTRVPIDGCATPELTLVFNVPIQVRYQKL